MKNINQVTLLGNITRSPELKYTQTGTAILRFSIATNRQWTDKESGEKKEAVDYHNLVFWGKLAELVSQFTDKGSRILVQGRLQTRSWEKDGVKRYSTEVIGNDFVTFDKTSSEKPVGDKPVEEEPVEETEKEKMDENINPEDIPF